MTGAAVRVAIVNDYPLVVAGLGGVLEPYADRVHLVELDACQPVTRDVDVILFDAFAHIDGLAGHLGYPTPVVVFTFTVSPEAVSHTVDAGAAGYVFKGVPTAQLVDAIERVHAGEQVVELSARASVRDAPGLWPGWEAGLSGRESEVLALICQGMTNQEIADQVYLSVNSVKTYIRTCYRKIGVATRPNAILWGVRNGFTPQLLRASPVE